MKLKIAHCADLHLNKGKKENTFKSKETFLDILQKCKNENVDILLVAGDLFDDVINPDFQIKWVIDEFEKFGIKTFISPGNHDPFTTDSPYMKEKWPKNVHIFKDDNFSFFEIPEFNLRVWGTSFKSIYKKKLDFNLSKNFDSNFINICVMHGNITNSKIDYYCPINLSDIQNSGMKYIALGHIHKRSNIKKIGDTYYAYSGSILSNGFSDTGSKGFYIIEISEDDINFEFKRVCDYSYEKISLDISKFSDNSDISNFILEKLRLNFKDNFKNNFYEITLLGDLKEDFKLDKDYIKINLKNELKYAKIIDKTTAKIDLEKLSYRNDFKALFIKEALKIIANSQSEQEKEINKTALKIGLEAFEEDVFYNDN